MAITPESQPENPKDITIPRVFPSRPGAVR